MSRHILIIGGVATGPKTAVRLRRLDPEAEITVIERQDLLSYAHASWSGHSLSTLLRDESDSPYGASCSSLYLQWKTYEEGSPRWEFT